MLDKFIEKLPVEGKTRWQGPGRIQRQDTELSGVGAFVLGICTDHRNTNMRLCPLRERPKARCHWRHPVREIPCHRKGETPLPGSAGFEGSLEGWAAFKSGRVTGKGHSKQSRHHYRRTLYISLVVDDVADKGHNMLVPDDRKRANEGGHSIGMGSRGVFRRRA